ncbi:MAG: hypothetical protein ABI442_21775 [Gemmatimonadaceae bacterium]
MKAFRFAGTTTALLLVASVVGGTAQAQAGSRGAWGATQTAGAAARFAEGSATAHRRAEEARCRISATLKKAVTAAQQRATELVQRKRTAEAVVHQQYAADLRQRQDHLNQTHDYQHDPYVKAPVSYRYVRGGSSHETNQYGADILRQAVNDGYDQGFESGRADNQDHWPSSYSKTYAYQDANYGYEAKYVSQTDYNYYFREGFRRGYADGYGQKLRYGSVTNGAPVILGAVLLGILALKALK